MGGKEKTKTKQQFKRCDHLHPVMVPHHGCLVKPISSSLANACCCPLHPTARAAGGRWWWLWRQGGAEQQRLLPPRGAASGLRAATLLRKNSGRPQGYSKGPLLCTRRPDCRPGSMVHKYMCIITIILTSQSILERGAPIRLAPKLPYLQQP